MFCLSGMQVRLLNHLCGDNLRDAQVITWFQFWLDLHAPFGLGNVGIDSHITVNNNYEDEAGNYLYEEINPAHQELDLSPSNLTQSGADNVETSDIPVSDIDLGNSPGLKESASVEDSEVELSRTSRRRRRKINHKYAVQHEDTSSENEERPHLLRRRGQKTPTENRNESDEDFELPGPSGI